MAGCFELPAYSTLDEMAARIRGKVNNEIFAGIAARVGPAWVLRLDALMVVAKVTGKSDFNRLKKTALRPSWTNFRNRANKSCRAWQPGSPDSGALTR